ncbi:MAG: DUF1080 domain-containing protein [Planctomycetota bacterium]|nr:DUF1080 domain-containing protein [Planctomycetota bacterium]
MLRSFHVLFSVSLVLALATATDAHQITKSKTTFTDAEEAGEDFTFQGEYAGTVEMDGRNGMQSAGLQVIARGNGVFDGVLFLGGLPGAGWNKQAKHAFHGMNTGGIVQLKDENQKVRIDIIGGVAIVTGSGRNAGQLRHIVRTSPTMGAKPPQGAVVIFDGTNTDELKNGKITKDGLLMEGADFKRVFEDFNLHLEFNLPFMPYAQGQQRANSGVYLQSRYEVQILDSFGLEGIENEAGALYTYQRPLVNMCYPPLSWQTYDIQFTSAKFDKDGKKVKNARLTVIHNGVAVQNDFEVKRKTGAGKQESPQLFPIRLQNHGNPVRFRNIWLVTRRNAAAPSSSAVIVPEKSAAADVEGSATNDTPKPVEFFQPVACCRPVKCCQPFDCCPTKKTRFLDLNLGSLFSGLTNRRCR